MAVEIVPHSVVSERKFQFYFRGECDFLALFLKNALQKSTPSPSELAVPKGSGSWVTTPAAGFHSIGASTTLRGVSVTSALMPPPAPPALPESR